MILPAPMLAPERPVPAFDDPGWLFELKHDGYRLAAGIEAEGSRLSTSSVKNVTGKKNNPARVQLRTRGGADATRWFPELVQILATVPGGPHIVDGEVCVFDEDGRADFDRLQDRARRRRWAPGMELVTYCVFDVLMLDGRDLMPLPIEQRKAHLVDLFPQDVPCIELVGHLVGTGKALYQHAVAKRHEGVMAKRLGSPYLPGERSTTWLKIKRPGAVPAERFRR